MKMFTGSVTYISHWGEDAVYTSNCQELIYWTGYYSEYGQDFISISHNHSICTSPEKISKWKDVKSL